MEHVKYWLTFRRRTVLIAFVALAVVAAALLATTEAFLGDISRNLSIDPTDIALITTQLFAVVDPIGAIPIYLIYDQGLDVGHRGKLLRTILVAVFALLLFFILLGPVTLKLLHISVASFQLGGGVILIVLAIDMLGEGPRTKTLEPDEAAVVPLASPLLVGPGTMASLIVLEGTKSLANLLISAVILVVLTGLILRFSSTIGKLLGKNGLKAVSRLLSIILAAIAAQMIHDALFAWGVFRL
jgi:multiple antibiotic resistance protein